MMQIIDRFLDRTTMYRLTVYYLVALLGIATIFSAGHILTFNPLDIAISVTAALATCLIGNEIAAAVFGATANTESSTITALIMALLIPPTYPMNIVAVVLASGAAIASKYLLTVEKHHVFNPVAAGAVALALLTPFSVTWWVGSPWMLPFVALGGWAIVRKTQREDMVATFLVTFFAITTLSVLFTRPSFSSLTTAWIVGFVHSALIFFATVMFTEPLTSPGTKAGRRWFAVATALLYATPQVPLFGQVFTPEMALVLANFGAFLLWPHYRYTLTLAAKKILAKDVYEFSFYLPEEKITYRPGQFMEWTLPHSSVDNRGNRRYFSLSSAPTEKTVSFAIKYYDPPSSYKRTLVAMEPGGSIIATDVAGDFTLPKKLSQPLVFVAGGIGVAPFRSMLKAIVDRGERANLTILYVNRHADEIAYNDLFIRAAGLGVKTYYILTDAKSLPPGWKGGVGHVDAKMIAQLVPDYQRASFYLSGPQPMVEAAASALANLSVPDKQIVTDFFPGYAT